MASEDSEDIGSAAVSDASKHKCDTVIFESRVASPRASEMASPRAPGIDGRAKSQRMSDASRHKCDTVSAESRVASPRASGIATTRASQIASPRASEIATARAFQTVNPRASEMASPRAPEIDGRAKSQRMSDVSCCKCDTVSSESLVVSPRESQVASPRASEIANPRASQVASPRASQIANHRASEIASPRASAAFGSYLEKAVAQGGRAFSGTDCEAPDDDNDDDNDAGCDDDIDDDDDDDDDAGCDLELIGKAAQALSEDINDRIRRRAAPLSPSPSNNDESATLADPAPPETTKVDQGCNCSQPDSEERSAQTAVAEVEVANTATQSSEPAPDRPPADPELLEKRASQLDERVRLLKERQLSTRKPSSVPDASSFAEQLKKIDLSLDGGTLKVCDRNMSDNALATLVNSVRGHDKLVELDLSGCCIQKGDDLADLVRNAPKLQRLLLAWNCLGSARTGVAALSSAIASATSLQEVDLRSNRIGPATAAALALALRTNTTLKRLDLMWNEIGASGATAILGLLEKNQSLTDVKLAGNNIPVQLLEQIDTLLETNRGGQADTNDGPAPDDCCEDCCDEPAEICEDGGSSVFDGPQAQRQSSRGSKTIPEGPQVQRQSLKSAEPAAKESIQQDSVKKMQDELSTTQKNLADVKAKLVDLETQKAELMKQLEASREEMNEETKRREQVERDLEEVRVEFRKNQQEMEEKLQASACESSEKIAALETETMSRRESERATLERETEVIRQNQDLTEQLAVLREDSDKRIQAMEAKSLSDAEYNAEMIQNLESSIAERDQEHLQEVESLRSQLTAEIDSLTSMKDNLLMEVEKEKARTELAMQELENQRQVLQQEKEAVEQELNRRLSMHMVEVECFQHHLEDKDKEHAKANQIHEECVQALENDLKKERARSELSISNAEQKIATMEDDMDQLKEKYKAEQERTMHLEERNRADELVHNSCMVALSSKHSEEQEKMKGDVRLYRKQIDALQTQNREMQAEHERRMKDFEIQLRNAKAAIVEWIQQQFSALQAALSFHSRVPAIEYGAVRRSHIKETGGAFGAVRRSQIEETSGAFAAVQRSQIEETSGAYGDPPCPPRPSQLLSSSPPVAKSSPTVSPRVSRVNQTMTRISNTSTPGAARPAETVGSRDSGTTTPEATPPPPSRISQTSPALAHTCSTPFLSVVSPQQDEEVATVEEDLVSSGGESITTEEFDPRYYQRIAG